MIDQCPTCESRVQIGASHCPKCETELPFELIAPDGTKKTRRDLLSEAYAASRAKADAMIPEHLRRLPLEPQSEYVQRMRDAATNLGAVGRDGWLLAPLGRRRGSKGPVEVVPKALAARKRFVARIAAEFRETLLARGFNSTQADAIGALLDPVLRKDLGIESTEDSAA